MKERILPFVAIDDFAFRKGHTYGTLFCDLKTGQPIDLLPTRKQEDVSDWINNHPIIQLISRDGSTIYKKAIEAVERPIVQVMDRFHLLQNLYHYMEVALQTHLPIRWAKKIEEIEPFLENIEEPVDLDSEPLNKRQQEKWKRIQIIQNDYNNGQSLRSLEQKYKIDRRTISKYVKLKEFPKQKQRKDRPSLLNPYLETIHQEVNNHSTSKQIYNLIKKQGFKGGFDLVRVRVATIRKELKRNRKTNKEKPFYRKRIIPLYWSLNSELKVEDRLDLNFALETFPETQKIYAFVQSFRDSLNQYDSISIQQLICNIKDGTIPELKTFAMYLFKDAQAIIASIYYTYSNGVIEGQINRLKTIKRTLYGRAGFEILRKRVLFHF